MTVDPFSKHPKQKPYQGRKVKTLNLSDLVDIISAEIASVENLEIPTWGFDRQAILSSLHNVLRKAEYKCMQE